MPQSSLMRWLSKPAPPQSTPSAQDDSEGPPTPLSCGDRGRQDDTTIPGHDVMRTSNKVKHQGLSSNVELRDCRKEDIKSFKRLNSLLLPIPYGDSFYREIMEDALTRNITLMALWHDDPSTIGKEKGILIGAIRCRLLNQLPGDTSAAQRKERPILYLSTLVLLSPYRGRGIAVKMLDSMILRAVNDYGVTSVGAHVWEANEEGLAWYRKRGFKEVGRDQGYYRRLDPQGAVVMVKEVGVMDLLGD